MREKSLLRELICEEHLAYPPCHITGTKELYRTGRVYRSTLAKPAPDKGTVLAWGRQGQIPGTSMPGA